MTSHVHDPEAFITDEGHVHEWCTDCGREWHLGTPRDPWEVLDECPKPTERESSA